MDLQLELESVEESDGYVWLGITRSKLGLLSPVSKSNTNIIPLNLTIYPIRTGIIHISGIRIIDLNRGEKFPFNDVAQVLIMNHDPSSSSPESS